MLLQGTEAEGCGRRHDQGRLLAQMRVTATTPAEYRWFSDSYLAELGRMHVEALTYLKRHVSEPVPAEAASIRTHLAQGLCPYRSTAGSSQG